MRGPEVAVAVGRGIGPPGYPTNPRRTRAARDGPAGAMTPEAARSNAHCACCPALCLAGLRYMKPGMLSHRTRDSDSASATVHGPRF